MYVLVTVYLDAYDEGWYLITHCLILQRDDLRLYDFMTSFLNDTSILFLAFVLLLVVQGQGHVENFNKKHVTEVLFEQRPNSRSYYINYIFSSKELILVLLSLLQ